MKVPLLNDFERTFNDEVWTGVARYICRTHDISSSGLERVPHGENIVFLIGEEYVLKIYTPLRNGYHRERAALEFAEGKTSLKIPEIIVEGEIEGFYYLVMTRLRGDLMLREDWLKLDESEQIRVVTQMAAGLRELHSHNADDIEFDWHEFLEIQKLYAVDRQVEAGASREWIESLPRFIEDNLGLLAEVVDPVFIHGDVHFGNLRIMQIDGHWEITGLFDFADSLAGFHEYEFVTPGVLMIQGQGDLQREMFRAYGYAEKDIDETLRRRLMLLTIFYECSNLKKYAMRLRPEAVDYTLEELERAILSFA